MTASADHSGHCWTSTASARSTGRQQPVPNRSGHVYRTLTAKGRSQRALPDLNRKRKIAVGTIQDLNSKCQIAVGIIPDLNSKRTSTVKFQIAVGTTRPQQQVPDRLPQVNRKRQIAEGTTGPQHTTTQHNHKQTNKTQYTTNYFTRVIPTMTFQW